MMAVWVHTEICGEGWLPHLLGEGLQLILGVDILPVNCMAFQSEAHHTPGALEPSRSEKKQNVH
jgi:hypothetical protein